jgi:uncharacterized protein YjiS (DUF1127 family)
MIQPDNCPYKGLAMCRRCPHYIIDTDQCGCLTAAMNADTISTSYATHASSYEDRLRRYYDEREKLLELSKEALVDLIIHRPDF